MAEKVINMDPLVKSTPQEPKLSSKPKQLKPAKQPPKRKSSFNDTIAVTGRELRAIHTQQRLMRLRRELEIEQILLDTISNEHD